MLWVLLTFAIINTILLIAGLIQLRRIKKEMATRQDVELLNTRLGELETEFGNIAADTEALKNELKVLNENTSIDLGPAIAKLEGMTARAKAIVGPNVGSDPEAPPVEEPPAEPPV